MVTARVRSCGHMQEYNFDLDSESVWPHRSKYIVKPLYCTAVKSFTVVDPSPTPMYEEPDPPS